MSNYADLEISLHRHDAEAYAVDFRFSQPESEAEVRLGQGQVALARFDLISLRGLSSDAAEYGAALSQALFAEPAVQTAFLQARASAGSLDVPLRVRLMVGPSAPELNSLRWETLRDPQDNMPLCTSENLLFSRYLSSLDWRPVRIRPKSELRALAFVASPSNLDEYSLAPVDVAGELQRIKAGLGKIPVTGIPGEGAPGRATLLSLTNCLRDGEFDILYIVCHGRLARDEAWLYLEDDAGETVLVPGTEIVTRFRELQQRPRLIVLGSCESASDGSGDTFAALGPRLAEAGIPAVIAMQGKVSLETIARLMPEFFEALQEDGQIDRALAVARGAVRERADYWMPALFMRLKSGRIWYVPGFGEDRASFERWPALMRNINRGQCTPILGHGLVEPLLGSLREIAQRWAETYRYPMAPHERESLPQVAQYLTVNQEPRFPYDGLEEHLQLEMRTRYSQDLPDKLQKGRASLDQLIETLGIKRRERNPLEPHKVLAELPLPIYITTNVDNQLASALREAGKDPQVVLCPWNEYVEQSESIYDREKDYQPSPERPLVYHLFGHLSEPDSIVLTEDDYFDFLIGVTGNKDLIPYAVRRALTDSALLFLGFQVNDWNFRVLFRSILSRQGSGRRARYAHIAAQIEPEEGRILEPDRARRYLEQYFSQDAINLFWGSVEDFIKELHHRWNDRTR